MSCNFMHKTRTYSDLNYEDFDYKKFELLRKINQLQTLNKNIILPENLKDKSIEELKNIYIKGFLIYESTTNNEESNTIQT